MTDAVYWVPMGTENEMALGGCWRFRFESNSLDIRSRKELGELVLWYPEELKALNFRVLDDDVIPDAVHFFQAKLYKKKFSTHFIHTGKYIFSLESKKEKVKWLVLNPTADDRFMLKLQKD